MTRPSRLVVASDEPEVCEVLARVLGLDGHEVARVGDQDEVPGQVRDSGASGVVLDLVAGGVGANLQALEQLRAQGNTPGRAARVVLIGALESQALFAWQRGIDGFLVRPFHERELRATMAEALDRSEDERQPFRDEMERRLLG